MLWQSGRRAEIGIGGVCLGALVDGREFALAHEARALVGLGNALIEPLVAGSLVVLGHWFEADTVIAGIRFAVIARPVPDLKWDAIGKRRACVVESPNARQPVSVPAAVTRRADRTPAFVEIKKHLLLPPTIDSQSTTLTVPSLHRQCVRQRLLLQRRCYLALRLAEAPQSRGRAEPRTRRRSAPGPGRILPEVVATGKCALW